jgi:hypothetical protein
MSVIAKFRCNSIKDFGSSKEVELSPVYPGPTASEEDKAFWTATPTGLLQMRIDNPDASIQFEPGRSYYLTFEEADVPAHA